MGWFRTLRDGTCSRLVFSHSCGRCHICDVRPCCRLPSRPTRLRCCGIAWSESSSIGQLGPPKQNTVDSTTGVYAFLTALGARSPRSKRQQARFLPSAPSLARGRPPSCCVRTWSSLCAHAHPVSLCVSRLPLPIRTPGRLVQAIPQQSPLNHLFKYGHILRYSGLGLKHINLRRHR